MKLLGNIPLLTPLCDELLQDLEFLNVPWLVTLRIMKNEVFVVFRDDPFVNIRDASILNVFEWSGK